MDAARKCKREILTINHLSQRTKKKNMEVLFLNSLHKTKLQKRIETNNGRKMGQVKKNCHTVLQELCKLIIFFPVIEFSSFDMVDMSFRI